MLPRSIQSNPITRDEGEIVQSMGTDEVLIVDERASMRPADIVESKLRLALRGASVGLSDVSLKPLALSRRA